MIVGLVTSIRFSGAMWSKFLSGLRKNGWEGDLGAADGAAPRVTVLRYEADGKYDGGGRAGKRHELHNAVRTLDANPDVKLIVATGGMAPAHAVLNGSSNKPFLLLFGTESGLDLTSNRNFCGGVNLDMVAQNRNRNDQLRSIGRIADAKKISFLWNASSPMGREEKDAWVGGSGWPLHQPVKKHDESAIGDAIAKAKASGAKGIVVSGDPYFTHNMNALVEAANKSKLKICYPFAAYASADPAPAPGSGIYLGPDLAGAYQQIGEMAGAVLSAINSGTAPPSLGLKRARTGKPAPIAAKQPQKKK